MTEPRPSCRCRRHEATQKPMTKKQNIEQLTPMAQIESTLFQQISKKGSNTLTRRRMMARWCVEKMEEGSRCCDDGERHI
ncbi:hypothetical protein A2U01_0007518 [Trifolium medium]|uniref:Uncharacterized protein n=1 Tax=Trifolium medium TaxID=97028 RepID=A0A392MIX7_9FABA|nr:hypothetical protein [Trifolium medium]